MAPIPTVLKNVNEIKVWHQKCFQCVTSRRPSSSHMELSDKNKCRSNKVTIIIKADQKMK